MFVNIKHILHLLSVALQRFGFTGCVVQSQTCEAVTTEAINLHDLLLVPGELS